MSVGPDITIELAPEAVALIERYQDSPFRILRATATGLDTGMEIALFRIREERLTGKGPFPVEEHRLGQVTTDLRTQTYRTPAEVRGNSVVAAIGTPVRYAGIHEFGAHFTRTTKPGKVRLREDRRGELLRRGNLATFAGKRHKLAREVSYEGGKTYEVNIPARSPFGFGLADCTPLISRKVSAAIVQELSTGEPS